MTCIHHSTLWGIFTALKIPCAAPIHPPCLPANRPPNSPPQPLATTLFIVSIVLPFPEYYTVEIIKYGVFSDCLLSLRKTHLRFLHVFSWLDSSFRFSAD